jgi:hypothetical protein
MIAAPTINQVRPAAGKKMSASVGRAAPAKEEMYHGQAALGLMVAVGIVGSEPMEAANGHR